MIGTIIRSAISQLPGFITGAVFMAFFYYRNRKKMDALVQKANQEKQDIIDKIKEKAGK